MRHTTNSSSRKKQQETRRPPPPSPGFMSAVLSMTPFLLQGITRILQQHRQDRNSAYSHLTPSHPMLFGVLGGLVDSIRKLLR